MCLCALSLSVSVFVSFCVCAVSVSVHVHTACVHGTCTARTYKLCMRVFRELLFPVHSVSTLSCPS